MEPPLKLVALPILLALVLVNAFPTPTKDDYGHCERIVKSWASSALDQQVEYKHELQDLLFFLHVPRTGGRTYFHCFLRKMYSKSLECPQSYDKLQIDLSKPECRLLATHDDYSIISKLPLERTSVMTILRNPVDRVFSTYEFSIEVAARFLVYPIQMDERLHPKADEISTLDVWPWKYLVPWMIQDLFARRDARAHRGSDYIKSDDPYNMEAIVMPLHEYINHPNAFDIVHNGATFQVAGLTNNSYLEESHAVRLCVQKYENLGEYVLQVAKKRLDNMLYVGLTEDHRQSATMFADIVGSQVISQLLAADAKNARNNKSVSGSDLNNDHQSITTLQKADKMSSTEPVEAIKENMTVEKLMETYATCTSSLRKTQASRRTNSFKGISPANFTKEARAHVSEVILQEILSLNNLDVELYKHAQEIFAKQQVVKVHKFSAGEALESTFFNSYGSITLWKVLALALSGVFLFVNAKRRFSKAYEHTS